MKITINALLNMFDNAHTIKCLSREYAIVDEYVFNGRYLYLHFDNNSDLRIMADKLVEVLEDSHMDAENKTFWLKCNDEGDFLKLLFIRYEYLTPDPLLCDI